MQKFFIKRTSTTPEINFSPDEKLFIISGISSPEDVRALYYPVIEWVQNLVNEIIAGNYKVFSGLVPIRLQIDLHYFNSSSAKFLFDILSEFKRLAPVSVPFIVEWSYEEEDSDMKDAGADIALLVGMEFTFIAKSN
jgi:capsule polysaccharide modification protein KpsS